jgi:nucleoside-diphosphate-sugar epimerase
VRVLVVGGTRFIGPPVVRRLVEAGHEVTVFHRGLTEAELPATVRHVHGNRTALTDYAEHFRALLPDIVVDMAAYSEREAQATMATFMGTAQRVVVISSQDVYRAYGRLHQTEPGAPEPVPYGEMAPQRERLFPYRGTGRDLDDYEKILVERVVMASPDLPGTVLRLPMVYGEGDDQRRLAIELRRMDDGRPAIVLEETFARWRWTRAYVENVAAAIVLAVGDARAINRIYNVGEADALSYAGWLREVARAAGWPGEVIVVPDGRLPAQLQPPAGNYRQDLVADTSRIRWELGYVEPVSRDDALRRTVAWERVARATSTPRPLDYAAEDALLAEMRGTAPIPAVVSRTPPPPPFFGP